MNSIKPLDRQSFIETSQCEDCGETTYSIPLPLNDVTLEDGKMYLHLTEDELMTLHVEVREMALHLD